MHRARRADSSLLVNIFIFSLLFSYPEGQLRGNVGNEARHLHQQSGEQNHDKHDQAHTHHCPKEGQDVFADGIIVYDHNAEEEQQGKPNPCHTRNQADKACLRTGHKVGNDSGKEYQEGQGCRRIAGCNIHILEAAFPIKQRGNAPPATEVVVAPFTM